MGKDRRGGKHGSTYRPRTCEYNSFRITLELSKNIDDYKVEKNRLAISMGAINKMLGMRLPGLRHVSPHWLNLLARVIGRHGIHFKKGT